MFSNSGRLRRFKGKFDRQIQSLKSPSSVPERGLRTVSPEFHSGANVETREQSQPIYALHQPDKQSQPIYTLHQPDEPSQSIHTSNQYRTSQPQSLLLKICLAATTIALLSLPAQAAPPVACPTEVEPMVKAMIRDLPGYANRIAVRSRLGTVRSPRSSIITAGRPEFEPLPLNSDRPTDPTLKQAFLTTLGREIVGGKAIDLQEFHWLFLTRNPQGWQLALMFTRIGTTTPNQPITPPTESREGVIGQAIQLWLRDCNDYGIRVRN